MFNLIFLTKRSNFTRTLSHSRLRGNDSYNYIDAQLCKNVVLGYKINPQSS
jgi:hypothetical protein